MFTSTFNSKFNIFRLLSAWYGIFEHSKNKRPSTVIYGHVTKNFRVAPLLFKINHPVRWYPIDCQNVFFWHFGENRLVLHIPHQEITPCLDEDKLVCFSWSEFHLSSFSLNRFTQSQVQQHCSYRDNGTISNMLELRFGSFDVQDFDWTILKSCQNNGPLKWWRAYNVTFIGLLWWPKLGPNLT